MQIYIPLPDEKDDYPVLDLVESVAALLPNQIATRRATVLEIADPALADTVKRLVELAGIEHTVAGLPPMRGMITPPVTKEDAYKQIFGTYYDGDTAAALAKESPIAPAPRVAPPEIAAQLNAEPDPGAPKLPPPVFRLSEQDAADSHLCKYCGTPLVNSRAKICEKEICRAQRDREYQAKSYAKKKAAAQASAQPATQPAALQVESIHNVLTVAATPEEAAFEQVLADEVAHDPADAPQEPEEVKTYDPAAELEEEARPSAPFVLKEPLVIGSSYRPNGRGAQAFPTAAATTE